MAGTGGRLGRIAAMAVALAIGLLLVAARGAGAGAYTVVQCGWGAGIDATWSATAVNGRLGPENSCGATGSGLGGALATATIAEIPIAGGEYGAWHWAAPVGAGIVGISGTWSDSLHGGLVGWLATDRGDGTFAPFATAVYDGDVPLPRSFAVSLPAPSQAFEARLLCPANFPECTLRQRAWVSVGELSLRLQDPAPPQVASSGELFAGGWRRGVQSAALTATDVGSGLRYDDLRIDGEVSAHTDLPCAEADVGGVVGTKMQPCQGSVAANLEVDTTTLDDGPHEVSACAADFAENLRCAADREVRVDNTAPGAPRGLTVAGGGARGSADRFDVAWTDPDQRSGSPVAAALWRVTGPAGYDTGVEVRAGRGISALEGLAVPGRGTYVLHLWLRDAAGNGTAANGVSVPLDDGAHASGPKRPGGGPRAHRGGPRTHGSAGPREPGDRGGAGAEAQLRVHLLTGSPGRSDRGRKASGRGRRASSRGGSLTVPFGAAATVAGRLVDSDGAGIADRRVGVVARPWRGALGGTVPATVRTGRHGGFELALAPGPARRVVVRIGGRGSLPPVRRDLELRVRSGITLQATPTALATGQEVHLSGRVQRRDARLPHPGKLLAIQYLETATHRWRPALVVRSDDRGRFDTGYRFRYVSGRARIELRATALAEERWPYAPGSSRPVTVEVHGR